MTTSVTRLLQLREQHAAALSSYDDINNDHVTTVRSVGRHNNGNVHRRSLVDRWALLSEWTRPETKDALLDSLSKQQHEQKLYDKNTENFIGTVKIPVGIAGPLKISHGMYARGSYYIPLATHEGALIASFSRGCKAISESGGAHTIIINEGMGRAPCFKFESLLQVNQFLSWLLPLQNEFKSLAATTSKHCKLLEMQISVEGNRVDILFDYVTGQAAGQNMTTFATNKIYQYILAHSPVTILQSSLEGGFTGDKKSNYRVLQSVRGRCVIAEVIIPDTVLQRELKTSAASMVQLHRLQSHAVGQIGTMSGNVANCLAAFYIACGQDPACVSESHVSLVRCEVTKSGDLYACITLPNLVVGMIGGGTTLPSQRACLDILGIDSSEELAEVLAVVCLAGEVSICAAFSVDQFATAHQKLARSGQIAIVDAALTAADRGGGAASAGDSHINSKL